MKKVLLILAVLTAATGVLFADGYGLYGTPEGDWKLSGNRLYQQDADAPRAKAWFRVPQQGPMIYEFTMRYEGGGEDMQGGAGIHILADDKADSASWGFGDSWLLWINYDEHASRDGKHIDGLSAVAYRSTSNKEMVPYASVDLNTYLGLLLDNLHEDIPVKLTVYPASGQIKVDDPRGETDGWVFSLPGIKGADGNYVAVRTNGVDVSFTSPDVRL